MEEVALGSCPVHGDVRVTKTGSVPSPQATNRGGGIFEVQSVDRVSGAERWVTVEAESKAQAIERVVETGEIAGEARLVKILGVAVQTWLPVAAASVPVPTAPILSPPASKPDRFASLSMTFSFVGCLFPLSIASIVLGALALRSAAESSDARTLRRKAVIGIGLSSTWLMLSLLGILLPVIDPAYVARHTLQPVPTYPATSERVAQMTAELIKAHLDSDSTGFTHTVRVENVESRGTNEFRATASAVSRSGSGEVFAFDFTVLVRCNGGERPRKWKECKVDGGESWWLVGTYTDHGEQISGGSSSGLLSATLAEWKRAGYSDRIAVSNEIVGMWLDRTGRKPSTAEALKPYAVELEACLSTTANGGYGDSLKVAEAAAVCCALLWPEKP